MTERLQQLNPYYEKEGIILWWGDCRDVLKELKDNSVDSIITDPPYSLSSIKQRFSKTSLSDANKTGENAREGSTPHARLSKGFMGKEWDSEIAFNPEVWIECLRVAKPGCILMAMGGSRTSHRLACAIEDAGWEIRDEIKYFYDNMTQFKNFIDTLSEEQLGAYLELHYPSSELAWVYGQGMGLGKNISKGIDSALGKEREVVGRYTVPIDSDAGNAGKTLTGGDNNTTVNVYSDKNGPTQKGYAITAPASELAKLFDGWYSRLKPAHENIIIAQKPIDKNYYTNAENWGVAGYNVDESRVGSAPRKTGTKNRHAESGVHGIYGKDKRTNRQQNYDARQTIAPKGRFPANIIHDNSDEVNKEFDKAGAGVSTGGGMKDLKKGKVFQGSTNPNITKSSGLGDKGTPARYFKQCPQDEQDESSRFIYTAKSSEKDKGKGNSHPTSKPLKLMEYLCRLTKTPTGGIVLDPFAGGGTTLLAAREEGRQAIGIEKEKEYCDITVNRLQGRPNVSPTVVEKEKEEKTEIGKLIDSVLYGE